MRHLLVSVGLLDLLCDSQSSRRGLIVDTTIRGPNAKIRPLFATGLGSWRTQIAKYGITLADIYNFDETGFMMGLIASGMVITGAERRGNPKSVQPGNRGWVTVIQAINAEGWAIQPFIVVAGYYHLASWYQECNLPGDWSIATTQNGWTDNDTGLEWLKHFDRHTKARSTGRYRLLILDGHEVTTRLNLRNIAKRTTSLRLVCRLIRLLYSSLSMSDPLDAESVISELDVQLRTPTPGGGGGQHP
jgi:hypothetical protein